MSKMSVKFHISVSRKFFVEVSKFNQLFPNNQLNKIEGRSEFTEENLRSYAAEHVGLRLSVSKPQSETPFYPG